MSAIKQIIEYTQTNYARRGEEYKEMGFEIDGKSVISLFDPPHLLKGIRKNLLVKNCLFTIKNVNYTAKWQHFIDLYNVDDPEEDLKMCSKLSENNLKIEKMPKMKVSVAAQIFSQRVGVFSNFAIKHSK